MFMRKTTPASFHGAGAEQREIRSLAHVEIWLTASIILALASFFWPSGAKSNAMYLFSLASGFSALLELKSGLSRAWTIRTGFSGVIIWIAFKVTHLQEGKSAGSRLERLMTDDGFAGWLFLCLGFPFVFLLIWSSGKWPKRSVA